MSSNWLDWGMCVVAPVVVACSGTWLARRYALRHRLVDQPGERRSHWVPTPRGGGIAIMAALLVAVGWLSMMQAGHARFLAAFGAGCVLVAAVGWIDDHRPLSPWLRLAVQALAAALLAWGLAQEGAGVIGATTGFVTAIVLVNVWNFMDGIDGIATTQAILAAMAFLLLGHDSIAGWLALALMAGCLGFLPFNVPRARIFLGDVGSGTLGFALAGIASWIAPRDWIRAPLLLLPLSAFLIDASWTLATRVARRQRWWLPHTEHAYQYWARRLGVHEPVAFSYAMWTFLACLFMFGARNGQRALIMAAVTVAFVSGSVLWWWSRRVQQRQEASEG